MSNLEKLSSAGLIAPGTSLSADEIAALDSMSEVELSSLIGARMHVREHTDEPPIPVFHVVF